MNIDMKKIISVSVLVIGLFAFILSIYNNNINFALIYLTGALISWVLYGLLVDAFDIQIFAWIISLSGFLVASSVLFMFGIEEVPYPVGAIIFHSEGFAGALVIGLFSLLPILFLHLMGMEKNQKKNKVVEVFSEEDSKRKRYIEEWEIASDDDLQSGEFEVG